MSMDRSLSAQVADEVRAMIGRRDSSKAELARRLDVSHTWVTNRLAGHVPISLDDLQRIAEALDVQITDLLPSRASARPTDKAYSPPVTVRRTRRVGRPRTTVIRHDTARQPTGQADNPQLAQIGRPHRRPAIRSWTHAGVTQ